MFSPKIQTLNAQYWNQGGNTGVTNGIIGITSPSNVPLRIFAAGGERIRISDASGFEGFIGIGSTAPQQKLHLRNGNIWIDGTGNDGNLFLGKTGTTQVPQWGIEYLEQPGTNSDGLNFWKPSVSGGVGFGNYFFFLRNDGKVGVGTNCITSDGKMAIEGKLYSREIEVNINNWCDYVFDPNYNLPSFYELKTYIKKHRHLSNLPSEKEIIKKGTLNLTEMNLALLEKIEELTLYILQLEERISKIENKLNTVFASFCFFLSAVENKPLWMKVLWLLVP